MGRKQEQTSHRGGNTYVQQMHKEMFSIISDQENTNQDHVRSIFLVAEWPNKNLVTTQVPTNG